MGLSPYKWYPKAEVDQLILHSPGELQTLQLKGYVLQFEPEKARFRFIWPRSAANKAKQYTGVFEEPDPIQKRDPLARVDSLLRRFIEDCKAQGRVPGLSDYQIRQILGPAWTDGRKDITMEEVKTVAAWFINDAEQRRNAANFKRTVRI